MTTTATRPARRRVKEPDPLEPIRELVRHWNTFVDTAQGQHRPYFREVLAGLDQEHRATFDAMLRAIPDPQHIEITPDCPTCHQAIRGDAQYLHLFGQVLDQVALADTRTTN